MPNCLQFSKTPLKTAGSDPAQLISACTGISGKRPPVYFNGCSNENVLSPVNIMRRVIYAAVILLRCQVRLFPGSADSDLMITTRTPAVS